MEEPENQAENKQDKVARIAPYMWKKGQSGNVLGRPKGKTMKEWAREYMERMTDEERDEFMEGIPKEIIWKMAEGNPKSEDTLSVQLPKPLLHVLDNNSDKESQSTEEEN